LDKFPPLHRAVSPPLPMDIDYGLGEPSIWPDYRDAGAGQLYYTVPVILKTSSKDGTHANYAACYIGAPGPPANFGEPPFIPMSIDRGSAKPSVSMPSEASTLATACSGIPMEVNRFALQVLISHRTRTIF